jgi:ketosteroid isomerase-like protein
MEGEMSESAFESYVNSIETYFHTGDAKAQEKVEEAANVRLVKDLMLAIARGDLATVGALLADDVRLTIPGTDDMPVVREAHGQAQLLDAIRENFGALTDQRPTVEAVVAQGDTVMVIMAEEGAIRETGKPYRIRGTQRFVIQEGKVKLVEEIFVLL